jgi:dihydrofolate reductase
VSSTLEHPVWANSTVLAGDVVKEVTKLKEQVDGDIVVYASRPLVRTLIENDLANELRLTVWPVLLGAGGRLFGKTGDKTSLVLRRSRTLGSGLVHLTYTMRRAA